MFYLSNYWDMLLLMINLGIRVNFGVIVLCWKFFMYWLIYKVIKYYDFIILVLDCVLFFIFYYCSSYYGDRDKFE